MERWRRPAARRNGTKRQDRYPFPLWVPTNQPVWRWRIEQHGKPKDRNQHAPVRPWLYVSELHRSATQCRHRMTDMRVVSNCLMNQRTPRLRLRIGTRLVNTDMVCVRTVAFRSTFVMMRVERRGDQIQCNDDNQHPVHESARAGTHGKNAIEHLKLLWSHRYFVMSLKSATAWLKSCGLLATSERQWSR